MGIRENERIGEGIAVLLNNVWYSAVVEFRYVNSRTLRVKIRFSWVKVCTAVANGPTKREDQERKRFWNNLNSFWIE